MNILLIIINRIIINYSTLISVIYSFFIILIWNCSTLNIRVFKPLSILSWFIFNKFNLQLVVTTHQVWLIRPNYYNKKNQIFYQKIWRNQQDLPNICIPQLIYFFWRLNHLKKRKREVSAHNYCALRHMNHRCIKYTYRR